MLAVDIADVLMVPTLGQGLSLVETGLGRRRPRSPETCVLDTHPGPHYALLVAGGVNFERNAGRSTPSEKRNFLALKGSLMTAPLKNLP